MDYSQMEHFKNLVASNMTANSTLAITHTAEQGGEENPANFYTTLFASFEGFILRESPVETMAVTWAIKDFFCKCFSQEYEVHLSRQNRAEYMVDVLVTTFRPKEVFSRDKNFDLVVPAFRAILAVESEIGGNSASSAGPLMRNVVEDYLKLLLIRSKYRVMIFTSLPYAWECDDDHVLNRARTMRDIYSRAEGITGGALLIHLAGASNRGTSGQVKVTISPGTIRGFVISGDASDIVEI